MIQYEVGDVIEYRTSIMNELRQVQVVKTWPGGFDGEWIAGAPVPRGWLAWGYDEQITRVVAPAQEIEEEIADG